MQQTDVEELIQKFHAGRCSAEEIAFLESWYAQWNEKIPVNLTSEQLAEDLQLISANLHPLRKEAKEVKLWPRIVAAASILLILSAGTYFFVRTQSPTKQTAQVLQDIKPGTNQATLTLANGKKIILTSSLNGQLARQGSTVVSVKAGSALTYTTQSKSAFTEISYNTLTTKRGEQSPFPLTLADGSKVWLNAASSITFPTSFNGKDRTVVVTGEAYFEVVHNANQPFKVKAGGQLIEDIGTHFNVNAYAEEPKFKTTLLEGSIRVNYGENHAILKPGQQAILSGTGINNPIKVNVANTKVAMAWKDGLFRFEQTDLRSVMRQVSRWYDLDIVYDGNVSNDEFDGQMSRDVKLSQLLKILESNQIHFQIKNAGIKKILIIKP
jgi:transmembrane sensor